MTAINQNFDMYAGDSKNIVISVVDEANKPLNVEGVTVKWILRPTQPITAPNILDKTTPEIETAEDKVTIKLLPQDTETLYGNFYHEAELTDQIGNVSTIMVGSIKINRSFA
jgi:hypothetical protein